MSWLFGKKKEAPKPKVDPVAAKAGIDKQLEYIGLRENQLQKRQENLLKEALDYKKKKNKQAAVLSLKKKKMIEQEINKLGGMKMLLMQQQMELEGASFDVDVFKTLKTTESAIKDARQGMTVEDLDKIREDLEESSAQSKEMSEFWSGIAAEGEDELLDELDKLESENVEEQMAEAEAPAARIFE